MEFYEVIEKRTTTREFLDYAKKIADKFDALKYLNVPRPYPITLGQKMYAHAMPR